ncbi:MAG: hypothetical protein IJL23_02095 [Alphaproteobacteria bacterium]|nr:hypothetical protein [Alphaproteobacteria bacterium]
MMRLFTFIILCLSLTGCNSIYMKPGTLDTDKLIYTPRGGETMQRSLKEVFDKRGYKTHVGQLTSVRERSSSDLEVYSQSKDIRYSIIIDEKPAILRPIWCAFNGFWWWRFSLAISDRKTGTEILSWRGRGCANSSLRKLNNILDELEMKAPNVEQKPAQPKKKVAKPNKQNTKLLILAK